MHQLLSLGAVNSLPEDLQWAIRMLLPRRQDVTPPAPEAATKPADALCHIVPPTAYLPYMLQPQQLAVLTQHAQQVITCCPLALSLLVSNIGCCLFMSVACPELLFFASASISINSTSQVLAKSLCVAQPLAYKSWHVSVSIGSSINACSCAHCVVGYRQSSRQQAKLHRCHTPLWHLLHLWTSASCRL